MSDSPPRVRAVGGVFFRTPDPNATCEWYKQHLGLDTDAYGTAFEWRHSEQPDKKGFLQWGPFKQDTDYFGDPGQQYMINYRVDDLEGLLAQLAEAGVKIIGETQVEDYGKFAHIEDLNGVRVELWEPVDEAYDGIVEGRTR